MFVLHSFTSLFANRRAGRLRRAGWHPRRSWSGRRFERVRAVLPALCGIGVAAVLGWLLAGGRLPSSGPRFDQDESAAVEQASGPPVHIASSPPGAQVRIDGVQVGDTPLETRLSPGAHTLHLQHPEALDEQASLQVATTGASVAVGLWRRRPDVLHLRPVYPGSTLLDVRFVDDGQVVLLIGLPTQTGAPAAAIRELWRLDPGTGQFARVDVPGMGTTATSMVLAPDGDRVAYVTPGSAPPVTTTGWLASGSAAIATLQAPRPESVWVAPLDGAAPPRPIFDLPAAASASTASDLEHIVDLVWTPDGSQLVAITRRNGPPVRARVVLLAARTADDGDPAPVPDDLVVLPAEVLPGSAVPDPSGRWLALVTRTALAPGGTNLLSLCVLQLRSGGLFRDLADLGSAATVPAAAPVAWPPAADTHASDRLVFVGPAPPAAARGGGLFGLADVFSALRPAPPSSGLLLADLAAAGLEGTQPRRLGSALNTVGPVWRSETTLLGFAPQADGTLVLRSIEPDSGIVQDLGVRLPAGTAQGTGLAARWDTRHGAVLLLSHVPNGPAAGSALQAWLVSFVRPSSALGGAH